MAKEYYGTKNIFTERVRFFIVISLLVLVFIIGQRISIEIPGHWSKNLKIEFYIDIFNRLFYLLGNGLSAIVLIFGFLLYEIYILKKKIKILEDKIVEKEDIIEN